jgi:molybdopterin synthase catalytic subunit/molybdopterin converting factor small subunit
MKQITVLFFANLKEKTGTSKKVLEIKDEMRIFDLKKHLESVFPGLQGALTTALVSINSEFAFDEDLIPQHAEVGFFPPVSGGGDNPVFVNITENEIDLNDLLAQITSGSTGAACIFTGMVRGVTEREDPHETLYLEYEAYVPMALLKMRQVADEIQRKWPEVTGISIVQRVGRLMPSTPTVMIACTAAHRDTGVFDAARYGIDRLKEIVPVWKKEIGPNGQTWVEGNYVPTRED